MVQKIERENYILEFSKPEVYVDNKARNRSGHMSHAMAEFAPNKYINFNANCSPTRTDGHSVYGWIEYRISEDGGETYSKVYDFPYSKQAFEERKFMVSVEKAVSCEENHIVAFCLRNIGGVEGCCEPWDTPTAVISKNGGKSWGEPFEISPYKGRIYDAACYNGDIYFLEFCNENFLGEKPEHVYRLYVSRNKGESFEEVCVVPFADTMQRGYGAMLFDPDGRLHIFAYNRDNEFEIDHIISPDCGKSWGESHTNYLAKAIRNPQVTFIDGVYIIHGRAEDCTGFVLYSSTDCENWDEGTFLEEKHMLCYYSNNITLKAPDNSNRLLIQYSECYESCRVNVMHVWMKVKKK